MVNQAMERWYAHAFPITGKKCFEVYHDTSQPCQVCPTIQTLKTGKSAVEVVSMTGEGRIGIGWLELYSFPLTDIATREITGVIEFVRDITERINAEKKLSESLSMIEGILQHAAEGLCVCHSVDEYPFVRFTHWNVRMNEITGYHMDEINHLGWYQTMYPDPEIQKMAIDRMGQMREGVDIRGEEWVITTKGGQQRPIVISTSLLTDSKGEKHALGVMQDITERKREEEKNLCLAAIVDSSDDAIIGKTLDGTITSWNQGAERIYGYKEHEVVGKPITILAPHDREDDIHGFLEQIKSGKSVKGMETVRWKKDGDTIPVSLTISPIIDKEGCIIGASTISRDISDRVKAAEQREALQEQLFQAQKMEAIGTLAGGFAHDFNNKLQVIAGYVEVILFNKDLPETLKHDLGTIRKAVDSSSELIKGMMVFSRKTPTELQPIELNKLVAQTRSMLTRSIPKMIEIDLLLADDLWPINAAPNQIDQILMNLTINARDAMPDGGKLTIKTNNIVLDKEYCRFDPLAKPGRYALITVSDTGIGMDKKTASHIFEPFFTTKDAGKGTGLGLAVVYGIVEQHGGRIVCDSEPSVGTTFRIYFPAIEEIPQEQHAEKKEPPRGQGETILVVDDESNITEFASRILTNANYRVITASNGKEALELYEKHHEEIKLVILDLMMPKMDGRRCLAKVLRIDPDAKVIIASGYSESGTADGVMVAGAKGFVEKPYNMRQLLTTIRDILDKNC